MDAEIDKAWILRAVDNHIVDSGKLFAFQGLSFDHQSFENAVFAVDQIVEAGVNLRDGDIG